MADGDIDDARDGVGTTLRELAWTIHRKAPDRAGVGPIPTTEIALLKQIVDAPGSTVGELAHGLGLRQPNVSAALRALIQRGFVDRQRSKTDRRQAYLVATPAGIAEHQEISRAWAAPVQAVIERLDDEDAAALAAAVPVIEKVLHRLRHGEAAEDSPVTLSSASSR